MFEEYPLREMLSKYALHFIDGKYTSFLNQVNINTIRKYSEYFLIDEERSNRNTLCVKLSTKGELFIAFWKL